MTRTTLESVNSIAARDEKIDLYLVASSFEPRSVRATEMIEAGTFRRAVVFNYQDTLDSVLGQENARRIRVELNRAGVSTVDVLPCRFSDPYGAVKIFNVFLAEAELAGKVRSVCVDVTCFTKLHLLTLLRYLDVEMGADTVRVCYTEPLSYATAFGKALSYGIERTVYLPYHPKPHRSQRIGLVAFLGHERIRVECIIQELEPDVAVIMLGEPGFTRDMQDDSRRINESLIHRSTYDRQYRLVTMPANDLPRAWRCLKAEVEKVRGEGCDSVYFAPLGTKLQALGIDMLRRSGEPPRMVLAYAIPRRYERRMYSLGSGPTYMGVLYDRRSGGGRSGATMPGEKSR